MRIPAPSFKNFRKWTSPCLVLALVSGIAFLAFLAASTFDGDYIYFHRLVQQEQLIDDSNIASYFWTAGAYFAFFFGAAVVSLSYKRSTLWMPPSIDERRIFKVLGLGFLFTLMVASTWIGGAVVQFGGISSLANLAATDNIAARDIILSASFPGGRLISSGFIGIAVLSATFLGMGLWKKSTRRKLMAIGFFAISLAYLGISPILVSGRINFFVAIMGSFIAASYGAGRIVGIKYLPLALAMLAGAWTAKQYFSLGHTAEDVSIVDQSLQGGFFYFYNDVLNLLNTISLEGAHTLGWYSMRFIFFFTFTHNRFLDFISDARLQIGNYLTAGEVPFLAAPIVDFGPAGLFILAAFGFLIQYAYQKAPKNPTYATVFGIVMGCLILSPHACFLTSQEVVYSILLCFFLTSRMRLNYKNRVLR